MKLTPPHLPPVKWALPLLILLTFAAGAFLRLYDITDPPLDFHATRQLFGAIRARAIYYQTAPGIPQWQREMAYSQLTNEAQLEPLLLENLTAYAYQFTGEEPGVGRAFSGLFWLVGGLFLFLFSKQLHQSTLAAYLTLIFYLFLPYAVSASRSFQPDPLMVMFILAFWWAMQHSLRATGWPAWAWTALAGLLGGLAIYVKLTAFFFVAGSALGLLLAQGSLLAAIKRPQTWLLLALGALPGSLYLYDGLVANTFLAQHFGNRTLPELWISPFFYLRWLDKLDNLIPLMPLVLSLAGALLFANPRAQTVLASLWGGYLLFGLVQTYHIASHDYYSLPVIPMAGLGIAPLAAEMVRAAWSRADRALLRVGLAGLGIFTAIAWMSFAYLNLRLDDYRQQAAVFAEIGEVLQHQPGVVALTTDYGYPLQYYGWQPTSRWPLAESIWNFERDFESRTFEKVFFIVTDFDELKRQPELAARLEQLAIIAETRDYVIYDLKQPAQP